MRSSGETSFVWANVSPASDELVSVRWELRTLLYLGVLLVTAGVGLLVKENFDRIGPVAVASQTDVRAYWLYHDVSTNARLLMPPAVVLGSR